MQRYGMSTYGPYVEQFLGAVTRRLRERLISFAVFGSVTRGEAHLESDIDVLIVVEGATRQAEREIHECESETRASAEYRCLRSQCFYPLFSPIVVNGDELAERPLILLDLIELSVVLHDVDGFFAAKLRALEAKLKASKARRIVLPGGAWAWDLKPDWRPGEVVEITL